MNIHRTEARRIAEDNGMRLINDKGLNLWLVGTPVTFRMDQTGRLPMAVEDFENLIIDLSMEHAANEGRV